MTQQTQRVGRGILRASIALAARFVHDAGAGGPLVQVTDPRTIRVLERGFLHSLRQKGGQWVTQVTPDVARALSSEPMASDPGGNAFYLAVAMDRLGRGTFLLHPVASHQEGQPSALQPKLEEEIRKALQAYLTSVRAPLADPE